MRALYRLLLFAYPPALRRAHGDEMTAVFDEAWRDARSRGRLARLTLLGRLVIDFLRCWPAAWRAHRTPSRRKAPSMSTPVWLHLKFALRLLRRHPASTAATLLTLTLAIGLNTAVFSVVHAVLLEPLPYPDAHRLVRIWERNIPRQNDRNVVSPANFLEWQDRATTFTGMAAFGERRATLTGDVGVPEEVPMVGGTWNLLQVLGTAPAHGRAFTEDDARGTGTPVVLVSWGLWQRRYGGDPGLVGRALTVNGTATEVVGILPEGFHFLGDRPELITPLVVPEAARIPRGRSLQVIARLAPGVSLQTAAAEMDVISQALGEQWKDFNAGWAVAVVGVLDDMVGPTRPVLYLLLAAVGIVLLVGCANTANLLLARAADRRRELAVRTAVGASRRDLIRQLLVEGFLLSALGAAGGVALASVSLRLFSARIGTMLDVPRLGDAGLDPTVLLFTLGLMALCALVFSVLPALHLDDRSGAGLVQDGRSATNTRRDQRIRQTLVVAQLALAMILVVTGGLVSKSLARLTAVDPGFDPEGVLTFAVAVPPVRYTSPEMVHFFDTLSQRLSALPGVTQAGGNAWLPFTGQGGATSFIVVGDPEPAAADRPVADIRPVTSGYFDTMRIPLRQGRLFVPLEDRESRPVVIVNDALSRQLFGNGSPLGRRLAVNWGAGGAEPVEIVGVVADSKLHNLTTPTRPLIYYPLAASPVSAMTMVLRTPQNPLALARTVEATVRDLDADLPVTRIRTMADVIGVSVATPAVTSWLVVAFAALTLVLAVIGIAGLQAATVAARVPEFGVRLALGATPGGLRRHVLAQGAVLVGVGLGVGVLGAMAVTRVAARELYDVTATDPVVFLAAAVVVAGAALLAADVPARRATRVDPAHALRR